MKNRHSILLYAVLVISGYINSSFAQNGQTVYITDILFVPMRSGASTEYRIINTAMKSGTPLTKLETSEDGEWSKVVTAAGTEGWIRNQYLSGEMTSQLKLNQVEARLARLEKENTELKQKNSELNKTNSSLSQQGEQSARSAQGLAEELDKIKQLSANAIDLQRRYQDLIEKHELTQTQRDSLLAENENMKQDQRLSFMLYGALILVFGIMLAIIVPMLKPKKRYSDWA